MSRHKIVWTGGSFATIAPWASSAFAQAGDIPTGNRPPYYYGHGMIWEGDHWGGFGMVLGPIFMILILVAIVIGVIYLLKHFGAVSVTSDAGPAADRALTILKERYARGEIDSKEFEERKKLLSD